MQKLYRNNRYIKRFAAIDYETAMASVASKTTYKQIAEYMEGMYEEDFKRIQAKMVALVKEAVPRDIPKKYRGVTVIYLKNWILSDEKIFNDIFFKNSADPVYSLGHQIERYFLFHDYVPSDKKDLLSLNRDELRTVVSAARKAEEEDERLEGPKYKEKVKEGSELIGENDHWTVWAPRNKQAAVSLGKRTTWCTSSRGDGNAFCDYYHPDDPLYIFISKKNPNEKYQFHYKSEQFNDAEDRTVKNAPLLEELHLLLESLLPEEKQGPAQRRHSENALAEYVYKLIDSGHVEKILDLPPKKKDIGAYQALTINDPKEKFSIQGLNKDTLNKLLMALSDENLLHYVTFGRVFRQQELMDRVDDAVWDRILALISNLPADSQERARLSARIKLPSYNKKNLPLLALDAPTKISEVLNNMLARGEITPAEFIEFLKENTKALTNDTISAIIMNPVTTQHLSSPQMEYLISLMSPDWAQQAHEYLAQRPTARASRYLFQRIS